MKGYIYLARIGGEYKLGKTTRTIDERMNELDTTSVGSKPEALAWTEVDDCHTIERKMHHRYANKRIRGNREFFHLNDSDIAEIHQVFVEESSGNFYAPQSAEGKKILQEQKEAREKQLKEKREAEKKLLQIKREEREKRKAETKDDFWKRVKKNSEEIQKNKEKKQEKRREEQRKIKEKREFWKRIEQKK